MFFYHSDSQEIDIEWISDANSTSNLVATNNGTRVMQYTNQGPHGTAGSSEVNGAAPEDATSAVHGYRIDWIAGLRMVIRALQWDPPKNDAVFRIQKIVMQHNTTADAGSGSQQNSTTSGAAMSSPLGLQVMVGAASAVGLAYLVW
ncbi:Putative concanavalin A-like lectin/glucanase domain superfamily [Septoria linicola]|uniref:Concanavalin A-like lectin/glucanase domain superfamily n=1 Tax=Septoria linicola TaxID=215465 RepID=A0A9Q9EGK0_9PEZI|nr:putative concanavalin A-like lectin/glucanase domain superfamily [Septoria linicola]USW50896.1 Putative concanavalin A-like lectin/glucanase domain superfamily [Septoria linicola]